MKRMVIAVVALVFAVACSKGDAPGGSAIAAPAKAAVAAPSAPAPPANQIAGTVVEALNGGGYTYLRIATPTGEEWAAVREVALEKGANVTVDAELVMEKFESKTLNRTFEKIVFGALAATAANGAGSTPSQHMSVAASVGAPIAQPAGSRNIAQLWSDRASLGGREVVVRGKVVKFRSGIMGTNWLHLQDGSGSPDSGDHDLTVTTDETLAVGEVVTVKGKVAVDKDFGGGYRYPVILEKATLAK